MDRGLAGRGILCCDVWDRLDLRRDGFQKVNITGQIRGEENRGFVFQKKKVDYCQPLMVLSNIRSPYKLEINHV